MASSESKKCPICGFVWTPESIKQLKRVGLTLDRDFQNHMGYHSLAGEQTRD